MIEDNKRKAGSTNSHKPMGPSINDVFFLVDRFINPITSPKISHASKKLYASFVKKNDAIF